LLTVRKHNADNGVKNLRIAELGSVYALQGNEHTETTELAIVMDAGDDEGIGAIRGVVNQVCTVVSASTEITVSPEENVHWLEPSGLVSVNGTVVGRIGRLSESLQKKWDLPTPVHVAQLHLGDLLTQFPPEKQSTSLPKQPAIERDITIIVDEKVLWSDLCNGINTLNAANLEEVTFVTTFRGKNIASGKKSLTLRLRFRDAKRTLTHDEVNEPVTAVIEILTNSFGAEIRS
jgi:phenylalanyl-tRNA synthetase beta chain